MSSGFQDWMQFHVSWIRRNTLRLLWHVVAFEFHLVPFGSIWFVGRNASEGHLGQNAPAVGAAGAIMAAVGTAGAIMGCSECDDDVETNVMTWKRM